MADYATCTTACTRDSGTDAVIAELKSILQQQFSVEHTAIQFECEACGQGPVISQAEASESMTTEIMRVT